MEDSVMKQKKQDIFDKIMQLPVLNIFEPFYKKHKEVLLYLFFGFLSFLISVGTYALFTEVLTIQVLIANVFAWIFSVSFAYVTNRIWVFEAKESGFGAVLKEIGKFVSGRLTTLLIEELILFIFITILKFESMTVKLSAQIIVILLNYIISKFWVFVKKE